MAQHSGKGRPDQSDVVSVAAPQAGQMHWLAGVPAGRSALACASAAGSMVVCMHQQLAGSAPALTAQLLAVPHSGHRLAGSGAAPDRGASEGCGVLANHHSPAVAHDMEEDRRGKAQRIQAVEHAAMAFNHRAPVFYTPVAFDR